MQESAQAALSYARSRADQLRIDPAFQSKLGPDAFMVVEKWESMEALKAQSVAARTFGARYLGSSKQAWFYIDDASGLVTNSGGRMAGINVGIVGLSLLGSFHPITPDSWRWLFKLAAIPAVAGAIGLLVFGISGGFMGFGFSFRPSPVWVIGSTLA